MRTIYVVMRTSEEYIVDPNVRVRVHKICHNLNTRKSAVILFSVTIGASRMHITRHRHSLNWRTCTYTDLGYITDR